MTGPRFEPGTPVPDGGIPLCVPELRGREWEYVKDCLDTGWVSSVGSYVTRFEAACASATETRHAVATINGTAALHVALLSAGVRPDDEVLVPALTFIAPANAVRYAGAWPVFVDAEPEHWQIDPAMVRRFLEEDCSLDGGVTRNKRTGRRVSAILPVDVLGHPADIDALLELARRFHLRVVEDATESLGARYKGRSVGKDAHVACLSFNGNKLVTTGGGGMIVTNDDAIAQRARYLTTQAKDDSVEYIHGEVGYNYRMTNVLAAIGCAQLESLDQYVAAKRSNAARYARLFAGLPGLDVMHEADWATSTFWLFTITVDPELSGTSSRALLRTLAARGIQSRPLWQPLHRSPAHAGMEFVGSGVADRIHARALSLPSSVGLTSAQLETVAETVASAFEAASRA